MMKIMIEKTKKIVEMNKNSNDLKQEKNTNVTRWKRSYG